MNESVVQGTGVLLQVGAQIVANGSQTTPQPVNWYDNITIHDPGVSSAYFYTAGNDSTPIGSYYDTEFVFGGEGNLEATQFTQMNSTLGLYYLNETSGQLTDFPSYYSFGGDTGEAAYNLHVALAGNGVAQITPGTPDYVYLSAAPVNTTTSQSTSTQAESTTNSSSGTQASTASSNAGSSAIFNLDYLIAP